MRLAIEMGGDGPAYGKIHRAGCRDLKDPETIGDAATRTEAADLAEATTYWGENDGEPYPYQFAPCVKF